MSKFRSEKDPSSASATSPSAGGALKRQIFVSYAHADDVSFCEGPGWVSLFVRYLMTTVRRCHGGASVNFWMDQRLEPQRRVNAELRQRIRESTVFLAFLSPRYIESEWCRKEMSTFISEVGGGTSADRVFLVETLPTERKDWHRALRDLTPFTFWIYGSTGVEPKTLGWPVPDAKGDQMYWDKVNALAIIIARQLLATAGGCQSVSAPAPVSAPEPVPAPAPRKGNAKRNAPGPAPRPDPETGTSPSPQSVGTPASVAPSVAVAGETHAEGPLNILIDVDDGDETLAEEAQALLAELDADAYIAVPPIETQSPASYRQQAESQLRSCDGVIVVYGASPPTWVQCKFSEVRKVLALERTGTWVGLLDGPPATKPRHGLPPRGLMVMNCKQGMLKTELQRFVEALRKGGGGTGVTSSV